MNKKSKKISFKSYIEKLNSIDINNFVSYLKNINLEDIKKIDIDQVKNKIKNSPFTKPSIGIFCATLLTAFLLVPSIQIFITKSIKAKKYKNESNNIELMKIKLKDKQEKIKSVNELMEKVNNSILKKEKLIFISKLINETAIKANVEISSITPIDSAKSSRLCSALNTSKSASRKRTNVSTKKGSFVSNFYEIVLFSEYLNILEFLKLVQYYDVTIIPHCLEVSPQKGKRSNGDNSTPADKENPTIIVPLSKSGLPLKSSSNNIPIGVEDSYERVQSRLVLKIPSYSR